MMCQGGRLLTGLAAGILIFLASFGLDAFQGMGTVRRPVGPTRQVETTLPPISVDFRDVAEQAGLTAVNVSGGSDAKKYILETTGTGVAIFDFDNDGLLDVFLPNATTLDGDGAGASSTGHLYRNLGALRFADVTDQAGLRRTGWGQGACFGDYDSDGHRDLFVTYYGQSALYHNQRDGSFREVTESAGLKAPARRWDTGCSFVDYDRDGRLDLVVTNYLEFDRAKVPEAGSGSYCLWKGMPVMCGPRGLPFARNYLFHNEGQGRFTDVSIASGIGRTRGCYAFTVVASDFDNDAWPDLYVACDSTPSLLYHNQKNGTFKEEGLLSGVALNEDGQEQGGMGVAVADYDEDGDADIVKTNFSDDIPNLYHNNGDGTFEDRVLQSGLGAYMEYVGWGVHFLDLDHDGLRDLLLINGHVYPEVERSPEIKYRQPRLLYWNVGGGRFKDISAMSGPAVRDRSSSSRGSAAGDLDNDGSLEVVVSNMGSRPSLLKNFGAHKNWLMVHCVAARLGADAFGARVRVHVGDRALAAEVQGASGYLSQSDPRVHFGLGTAAAYQRIEVRWPSGERERFRGGKANQVVVIKQGTGERLPDGA
jgi:enediyne biosynthesis protein E4